MLNENIPRWLNTSIFKHFEDVLNTLNYPIPIFVEGEERDTNEFSEFVEFRTDGPYIDHPSKNFYAYTMEINALIQSTMNISDAAIIEKVVGRTLVGFTDSINVFRYGDGIEDDCTLLGCLKLIAEDGIETSQFHLIRPDSRILQSTIEGHYKLTLN